MWGPQVWASRPGRARVLAQAVDRLLSIHAFDAPYFEAAGLKTTFVGNSALARDFSGAEIERLRAHIGAAPDDQIVLVLPGSRPGEVSRLMPIYKQTVEALAATRPGLRFVLPAAETVSTMVAEALNGWTIPVSLLKGEQLKYDAMRAATVALACSGTVSTELALAGCPMVIAYRVGRVSHFVLKRVLTTKYATPLQHRGRRGDRAGIPAVRLHARGAGQSRGREAGRSGAAPGSGGAPDSGAREDGPWAAPIPPVSPPRR